MMYVLVMITGALIMFMGISFGWAMAVNQYKNQKVNIVVHDKNKEVN